MISVAKHILKGKEKILSKSQKGECRNDGCSNPARNGAIKSAYCQPCSDKHRKKNA